MLVQVPMYPSQPRKSKILSEVYLTIEGYSPFPWVDNPHAENRDCRGLIVSMNNHNYIITQRQQVAYSKHITGNLFTVMASGVSKYVSTPLEIIYQSMEYNMAVLVGINRDDLDNICDGVPGNSYVISGANAVMNKLQLRHHDHRAELGVIGRHVEHVYDIGEIERYIDDDFIDIVKYRGRTKNRIPSDMYCGCAVVNKRGLLVGMVVGIDDYYIFDILPIEAICSVMDAMMASARSNPLNIGSGLAHFPCSLRISGSDAIVDKTSEYVKLRSGDIIVSIDRIPVKVANGKIMIFDDYYKMHIPLITYIQLRCRVSKEIDIRIIRENRMKIITAKPFFSMGISNSMVSSYKPEMSVEYKQLRNRFFVKLSHELLDIFYSDKISMAEKYIREEDTEEMLIKNIGQQIIMIDADDDNSIALELYRRRHTNEKLDLKIPCPFVRKINGKQIKNIEDIDQVCENSNGEYELFFKNKYSTIKKLTI